MWITVDLQAVTDRVLGHVGPIAPCGTGGPRRGERRFAITMLGISATATLTSLGLWISGHGIAGLRVFCGAILLLLVMFRTKGGV